MKRRGPTPRKRWIPMERGAVNPTLIARLQQVGEPEHLDHYEAWGNDVYQALVRVFEDGLLHISFKRHDRKMIREWRHIQAIKNEIAGAERTGIELFPPESNLMDTSNEYHLFVLPEGVEMPFGYKTGIALADPELIEAWNARDRELGLPGLARQTPWQEGLPVGLSRYTEEERDELLGDISKRWDEAGLGKKP